MDPLRWQKLPVALTILVSALACWPWIASAHEIPADIRSFVLVKPEGKQFKVLVRVPLAVVRDFAYPEQDGGFLDFESLHPQLPELAEPWIAEPLEFYENGALLPKPAIIATQLSFASDRAFSSWDRAVSRVTGGKLDNNAKVVWNQLWFDVMLEYEIQSESSSFSVRTGFSRLAASVSTALLFLPPGAPERAYSLHSEGANGDTGVIPLDPRWHQVAARFVSMGFEHILSGIDHLLFLGCLVIPLRRFKPLLVVVTAFTCAHSITLLAAALGYAPDALWFPPLIEVLIALSIVYMAFENIVRATAGTSLNPAGTAMGDSWRSRWAVAFSFGLIHGFGFSFALRESLQFAGGHLATSLAAFNVGVELGQLSVLLVLVPLLWLLFRYVIAERIGVILLSALIAHTGWHWMLERGELLSRFGIGW